MEESKQLKYRAYIYPLHVGCLSNYLHVFEIALNELSELY